MTTTSTSKMHKRDYYEAMLNLLSVAETAGVECGDYAALNDFCSHEIEMLESKNAAAQARRAEKAAKSDEVTEQIAALLTAEPMTARQIADVLNSDMSDQMIVHRVSALIKAGRAAKTTVSIGEKGTKRVAYTAAQ